MQNCSSSVKAALLALILACAPSAPQQAVLRRDVPEALAQAALHHAPVLVFYRASWCSACQALGKSFDSRPVAQAAAAIGLIAVQVEVGGDLVAQANLPGALSLDAQHIVGLPTLIYTAGPPTWAQTARITGYLGPDRLAQWLRTAHTASR